MPYDFGRQRYYYYTYSYTYKRMATPIQQNLTEKNKAYASTFSQGDLTLPPAKKYAVGKHALYSIQRLPQNTP